MKKELNKIDSMGVFDKRDRDRFISLLKKRYRGESYNIKLRDIKKLFFEAREMGFE